MFIKAGDSYTADEVDPGGPWAGRQRELSRQFGGLIDVLYALVLVEGAVNYREIFTRGGYFSDLSQFLPVLLALILVYGMTVQSYVDFHLAAEDQPFQMLDGKRRAWDLGRFYLDLLIVALYSFLLLKCHVLIDAPDADLLPVFVAMPTIFVLYFTWGLLRWKTSPRSGLAFSPWLLLVTLLAYLAILALYCNLSQSWQANAGSLALALVVMVVYRLINWPQNRAIPEDCKKPAKAKPAAAATKAKPARAASD